jgi:hypothetical protein
MAAQKYEYNYKVKGRKWSLCSWAAARESKPLRPQRFLGKTKLKE